MYMTYNLKPQSQIRNSLKAMLDDLFTYLFYTAAPVHPRTTIGNNFPCVDKFHSSVCKNTAVLLREKANATNRYID